MSGTSEHRPDNDASLDWMRQIQLQQRVGNEDNGVLRNIYKRAKNAGEKVDVMRWVIRQLKAKSPEEIVEDLKEAIRLLTIRRVEITPDSLFDGLDLRVSNEGRHQDDIWDAQVKGYQAGRLAVKVDECPYHPPGSELHTAWLDHWHKGQAAIARELGPDAQQADASRQRPSRRKQGTLPGTDAEESGNAVALKPARKKTAAAKKAGRKGAPRKKTGRRGNGRTSAASSSPTEDSTSVH